MHNDRTAIVTLPYMRMENGLERRMGGIEGVSKWEF
jgi:hypothetical protein